MVRTVPKLYFNINQLSNESNNYNLLILISNCRKLSEVLSHFFRRIKNGEKPGFPKFKRKDVKGSFSARRTDLLGVFSRKLRISRLKTYIDMRQPLRFRGKLKQVTISKKAGKYFASFLIDTDDYVTEYPNRQESVGREFNTCRQNLQL